MTSTSIAQLALPAVAGLIVFLSYGPQLLFNFIEPSPLGRRETFVFNACIACTWICYVRACFTDPGRVPSGWKPDDTDQPIHARRQRWCRKCEAFKPPRAHHCKTCQRYIRQFSAHLSETRVDASLIDAYPRWITIVPGPSIAFHIVPFLISSAFSSTLLFQ